MLEEFILGPGDGEEGKGIHTGVHLLMQFAGVDPSSPPAINIPRQDIPRQCMEQLDLLPEKNRIRNLD